MKLHVNWGHESAQQSKRVLADLGAGNTPSVNFAGEISEQRDVRRSFDAAPLVLNTGTPIAR